MRALCRELHKPHATGRTHMPRLLVSPYTAAVRDFPERVGGHRLRQCSRPSRVLRLDHLGAHL